MGIEQIIVFILVVIGGFVALWGIFRPSLGLLVLIAIHFMQPGELVPALDFIHIERTYSIAMLAVFIISRMSIPGPSILSNRIVLGSFFLIGAAAMSIPFAVWRGGAAGQTIDLVKNVVLLVLIVGLIDNNSGMKMALWTMVAIDVWYAGSALIAYAQGNISFQEGIGRAMGVNSMVGGPNELAGLILALLPFLIALIRCSKNIAIRLLLIASGGISLAALVLTGARASMLALVLIGIYYIVRSKHKIAWLLVCVALATIMWLGMPQAYRDRYMTVGEYASGGQLDASNELRLRIWHVGWQMFLDHPILGVGAGQFSTAYGTLYLNRAGLAWMNPHNLFLQVACELGIVGVIAFMYFLVQIIKQLLQLPPRASTPNIELNYQVATASGAMLIALIAISVVSHTLYRPYWYFLGGFVAANFSIAWAEFRKKERADKPKEGLKEAESAPPNQDNLLVWSRSG